MNRLRRGLLAWIAMLALYAPALAGGDWNDGGIRWRSFEGGMAEAKAEGKPVCLVIYTEWCPHCTNYAKVFHDEKIEALAKDFVMVRLDQDQHESITKDYGPDGLYIPRTLFLTAEGEVDPAIKIQRSKYVYFYDERDPSQLGEAMKAAAKKLQKSS